MNNQGFQPTEQSFEMATRENTAVAQATQDFNFSMEEKLIADLSSRNVSFCSFEPKTDDERDILFIAMNNPEKRIKDCINEVIEVRHIFCEVVYVNDEHDEGTKQACPRIVLIDKDGVGYQAVSLGIYSAVKKMIQTYGNPMTWKEAKAFKIVQITKGTNSLLTFNPVTTKKK